jgi:hypothetical protein
MYLLKEESAGRAPSVSPGYTEGSDPLFSVVFSRDTGLRVIQNHPTIVCLRAAGLASMQTGRRLRFSGVCRESTALSTRKGNACRLPISGPG